MDELSFVFDPENNSIYLLCMHDDPWPLNLQEAMRLCLELQKAITEATKHEKPIQQ